MSWRQNLMHYVFCLGNIFSWDYDSLVKRLKPSYSEDGSNDKLKEYMLARYLWIFLKDHLWMVRWSWKVLFVYEIISCTLLILIQFVILVLGIHSLLLDRILIAKRLILFAKMWSLICYEWIFNINKNNVALLKY